jgi:hypothetical protein
MSARDDHRWNEHLKALLDFKARYGHCEVPRFFEDRALGSWVNSQRSLYAHGRLRPERLKRLQKAASHSWSSGPCADGPRGLLDLASTGLTHENCSQGLREQLRQHGA